MVSRTKMKRARELRRRAAGLERRGKIVDAVRLYERAKQLGDLSARARLAIIRHGDSLWRRASALEDRGKIEEARRVYLQSARLGNLSGMLNLANLLDDAVSPPKPRDAVYWYKRGIKRGSYTAALNLAIHYQNLGQHRWYLYWIGVAVKMGDPEASAIVKKIKRQRGKEICGSFFASRK